MGLPGQAGSRVLYDAWDDCTKKVRTAGKHLLADHIEALDTFASVRKDAQALLEKHGRTSQLAF